MKSASWRFELRLVVAAAVALALAGCGATTPAPSATAAGSVPPGPSGGPASSVCPDLDLRLANGDPLDLTGTWLGNDDSYWTFTQARGCVWATATDRYESQDEAAVYWQIYLRGSLEPDFTVPVEYAYSPLSDIVESHSGHAVLTIEFSDAGEVAALRKTAGCTGGEGDECPPGEGTLQTTLWTRISPTVILPPPTPEP